MNDENKVLNISWPPVDLALMKQPESMDQLNKMLDGLKSDLLQAADGFVRLGNYRPEKTLPDQCKNFGIQLNALVEFYSEHGMHEEDITWMKEMIVSRVDGAAKELHESLQASPSARTTPIGVNSKAPALYENDQPNPKVFSRN
jgi:hypothetical protein